MSGGSHMLTECSKCHKQVCEKDIYHDKRTMVCETCYMESHIHYVRKTHWRYIRSIRVDYLQPAKKFDR